MPVGEIGAVVGEEGVTEPRQVTEALLAVVQATGGDGVVMRGMMRFCTCFWLRVVSEECHQVEAGLDHAAGADQRQEYMELDFWLEPMSVERKNGRGAYPFIITIIK